MGVDERLARDAAKHAAEAARDAGSAHQLADAVWAYCRFVRVGWRGDEAAELAEEALRLLGEDDVIQRARVTAVLAMTRGFAGERAESQRLADHALALARRAGDDDTLANALISKAVSRWGTADVETMRAASDELFTLGIGPERPYLYLFGMRMRATVQLLDVDLTAFDETVATTEGVARQVSYGFFVLQSISWRAMRMLLEGRWKEAEQVIAELVPMSTDPNGFLAWAGLSFIGQLERGRAQTVVPLFEQALAKDESLGVFRMGAALGRLDMGDVDGARQHYDEATRTGVTGLVDNWMLPVQLSWLAHVTHHFEDQAMAADVWKKLEPFAGLPVIVASGMYVSGAWDRYRGLVASTLGRHDEAVALVQAAIEVEARLRARPQGARSELALGQVLLARSAPGDHDAARVAFDRCRTHAETLGMRLLTERAGALAATL
jgi:tetratricopeptide (TPR) repeat protein